MVLLQEMIGVAMFFPIAFVVLGLVIFAFSAFVLRVFRPKDLDQAKKTPYFLLFFISFFLSAIICVGVLANMDFTNT
jgi:hypothetical protein